MKLYTRLKVLALVIGLSASLLPTAVGAQDGGTARVTRGDAEAIFNAFPNGGWAIRLNKGVGLGAPADGLLGRATIRPFDPFDGARYCADDWHVITTAWVEGGDSTFTYRDAAVLMEDVDIALILDGNPLVLQRTAVKRFLNPEFFGWEVAYAFQEGRIMSPGELSVGAHTLGAVVIDGFGNLFENTIQFYVDPTGSPACSG
jgi:hypothetical protein